jgi:hypothetical protein
VSEVLIEAGADVQAMRNNGVRAIHWACYEGRVGCLKLLMQERADMNARSNKGSTPAMFACQAERLTCLQLHLYANANASLLTNTGRNALYYAICISKNSAAHRVPGMPFSVLSCNTDVTDMRIDEDVTQEKVDAHVVEYKAVHAFIDEYHSILKHALSYDVQVDTRFGLREHGIYQEPLERVLEYMGLSMYKDQVVNRSIDGDCKRRALRPGNVLEANHWHEQHTWAVRVREMAQMKGEMEAARRARRVECGY